MWLFIDAICFLAAPQAAGESAAPAQNAAELPAPIPAPVLSPACNNTTIYQIVLAENPLAAQVRCLTC